MKISEIERTSDGKLPEFAWPGGYPIVYYDADGETLCANCAMSNDPEFDAPLVAGEIYEEGPTLHCAGCNCELPSAYGDPDADEE